LEKGVTLAVVAVVKVYLEWLATSTLFCLKLSFVTRFYLEKVMQLLLQ